MAKQTPTPTDPSAPTARADALARADARRDQRLAAKGGRFINGRLNGQTPIDRARARAQARAGGYLAPYLAPNGAGAGARARMPVLPAPSASAGSAVKPTAGLLMSGFVVVLGLAGFLFLRSDLVYAASNALIAGLVGLGLFLPLAALQEMPLWGAGLEGLSAYLFAYFAAKHGPAEYVLGVLVAMVVVTVVSMLGGTASVVVTGLYFVVASLVIQVGLEKVIFPIGSLTGGAAGRSVAQPHLTGHFDTNRIIFAVIAGACLLLTLAVWSVMRSRIGSHAVLVGWAPEGASAVGLANWRWKLMVFGMSGAIISVAGCLVAFNDGTPPPAIPSFIVIWSVVLLAIPVASGLRNLRSLWLVAAIYTVVPVLLQHHHFSSNMLSGVILLIAIVVSQTSDRVIGWVRRHLGTNRESNVPEVAITAAARAASRPGAGRRPLPSANGRKVWVPDPKTLVPLVGSGLSVSFGGVQAVDGVDIRVEPGQRVAIVGGNGAGKTTLFNGVTGFVQLDTGQVRLGDADVTHMPSFARARAGVRRTFQIPRLADVLTVGQNVRCGQGGDVEDHEGRVAWLMERFGLTGVKDLPISALPFGYRRKTEIVRALARGPRILMMDEPVSGLEDDEVTDILNLLLEIQAVEGWGLLVIEHDLRFVTGIAEQLVVMETGRVINEGDLHSVLSDDRVRRVYLGELI